MAFPRAPQIVVAVFSGPLAGLWMAAVGWVGEAALTTAIMTVATMLAAAVGLAVADWLDETKSRKDWAAMGIATDDLALSAAVPATVQADQLYPPMANDDALCAVLRAYRHAAASNTPEPVIDIRSADGVVGTLMSGASNALPPAAVPLVERTCTVGGLVDAIASREGGRTRQAKHEAQEGFCDRAPIGLIAVLNKPRQLKVMSANRHAAGRTRLAANGGPLAGWPGSDQIWAPRTVPIKIVSDIIILGQGKRRQSGGEPPPSALPGGSIPSTGVPARTSIVASTAPDRRQRPRAAIKSLQPGVCFEAQRQLIALAQALARQAAREDDAAERAIERSRSPPDVLVEILPGGGAREDTS